MGKLMAMVDGSAYSESVCRHAAWIAGRTGADVALTHVLDPRRDRSQQDLSGAIRLGARSELLEQLSALDAEHAKLAQKRGRAILDDARALIEAEASINVETSLRRGDIVETVATQEDATLLLIGKRGEAAGLESPHLGSNFERIVRASSMPVFVANRAFKPIRRVLVAFDGGSPALRAIEYVAREPLFAGLEAVVVMAGSETPEARRALDGAVASLRVGGLDTRGHLREGAPHEALGAIIEEDGVDLLVMGAYAHSRIRSMVLGSTTSELIRTCRVPILLMR